MNVFKNSGQPPEPGVAQAEKPRSNLVGMNVRLEPSLKKAIEAVTWESGVSPGGLIRRLSFQDITRNVANRWKAPEWIKEEPRAANLNFLVLARHSEAIRLRAKELNLSLTDYIRSLAIFQVFEAEKVFKEKGQKLTILDETSRHYWPTLEAKSKKSWLSKWTKSKRDPDLQDQFLRDVEGVDIAAGYTTYKGKKIIELVKGEAEKEGLSLAAYQKKLVYEDLERKYGMKFVAEILDEPFEQWEMYDDFIKRVIDDTGKVNMEFLKLKSSAKSPHTKK